MGIRGSKGSSKTKTQSQGSQTYALAPELHDAYFGNLQRSQQLANTPFTPYTGPRVAGFSPRGIEGQDALTEIARGNVGGASLAEAQAATRRAAAYTPTSVAARSYTPTMAGAAGVDRRVVRDVGGEAISPDAIAAYFDPYQDQVIGGTLADLERQRQIQQAYNAASAVRSNAFGGTGAAVAANLTDETFARQAAQAAATQRSQGWNAALQAAQADATRRLQAAMANQGMDWSVVNANAGYDQQARLFNAGAVNDASRYGADQAYQADLANQQAGLGAAGLSLQAAAQLGQFAAQERTQAVDNANLLNQVGDQQRQAEQAMLDAQYEEYLRAQNYPLQVQQLMNQTIQTLPNFGTTTSQESSTKKEKKYDASFKIAKIPGLPFG